MLLIPAIGMAQEIDTTIFPIPIDRAMSPWARERVDLNFSRIFREAAGIRSGDSAFTEINSSGDLNIIGNYPGLLGTKVTNTYGSAINVAGAVHQLTNDLGYWSLIGMTSSESTILGGIFQNTFHFYNQGYGNTLLTVDGNKDFVWYSDPTDSHDFSALDNEIMRLKADGALLHQASAIKAHITSKVDAEEVDTWRNFTGFTEVASEGEGDGMELLNDSTMVCKVGGLWQFGGCVHVQNNTGGGFDAFLILSRIFKNGTTEARCSQRGYAGSIRSGGEDVLSYNGTDSLAVGDTLRLQYYTNNIDTDFDSNAAFDNSVAATMWLTYLGTL